MLVQQSFLVLDDSPIRAVADVDRTGQKIAGTRNDSVTLFMKRKLKAATLVEIENNPAEIKRMLTVKEIDAFGANRQRLTTLMKDTPGTRLLPDSLFGVPQTIIVPKGKPEVLAAVNRFIDEVRAPDRCRQSVIACSRRVGLTSRAGAVVAAAPGRGSTITVLAELRRRRPACFNTSRDDARHHRRPHMPVVESSTGHGRIGSPAPRPAR